MKKSLLSILCALALLGCTGGALSTPGGEDDPPSQDPEVQLDTPLATEVDEITETPLVQVALEDFGPAPELANEVWLNTDSPLRLEDLRGNVVLLDMWTFGCINCQHVIPSLRDWHETYASQGLVVIGNHYPEFTWEEDLGNLKDAIVKLDVPYAVAQDNDGVTWRAYRNRYWPTLYLIDKRGHIRYQHIGEGRYAETEAAIQTLLAESYP